MLIQMLPDQVSKSWPVLRNVIEKALPPLASNEEDRMAKILEQLLTGEMICWASFRNSDVLQTEMIALVLTTLANDYCTGAKNLLIYAVSSFEKTIGSDWVEGYQALAKFAKKLNCQGIIGYSKDEKVLNIAEKFGSDISFRLISVPI